LSTIRRPEITEDSFRKLRVLFLRGKNEELVGVVRASNMLGDDKSVITDEIFKQHRAEQILVEECRLFHPDLIIFIPPNGLTPPSDILARTRHNIPVLMVVTNLSLFMGADYATYCGITDLTAYRSSRDIANVLLTYNAVDSSTYYDRSIEGDFDVTFIGEDQSLWKEYIRFLADSGINVHIPGQLEPWRMNDVLNRSKISLNFNGRHLFEITSCGAMMMDIQETEAREFFEPEKEMVVFSGKQDLLNKVRYYLKHQGERYKIAAAGLKKATEIWSAWNCWGLTFERMGFYLPAWLARDPNYRKHRDIMEEVRMR